MGAPTHTYCDYGAGNDYKGASFTDGAYTSATKTLVKASAFAASKVNHWLKLSDNGSGNIVDGYYKIATWTDANTVILATDAGGGSDAVDVVCVQADGTTSLPWRSIQGAFELITRDATNGNQVNVINATTQVNAAASNLTTYGTPTAAAYLAVRGCTAIANDGGMAVIDCGGFVFWNPDPVHYRLIDLEIHTMGNNNGIQGATGAYYIHCNIHKGASSPSSKYIIRYGTAINCYLHDYGGYWLTYQTNCYWCHLKNGTYGMNTGLADHNVLENCYINAADTAIWNSVYITAGSTATGIGVGSGICANNLVEGFSGAGGVGIASGVNVIVHGYNATYNCTTSITKAADIPVNLGGDVALAASPFTNAAGGDFSLNTAVVGAIDGAFPGAWYGPASTTDHADIGAVQNGAGTGGAVSISPLRGGL